MFKIYGKVTAQNLGALGVYFKSILEIQQRLVISLENIEHMDAAAALFFEQLYRDGAADNRVVALVGEENRNISQVMELTKTKYILSPDRV